MPPKAIDTSRISTRGTGPLESVLLLIFSSFQARPIHLVEPHRCDQHGTYHHVLVSGFEIEQRHARLQRLHKQSTQHGAVDCTYAAGERCAADDSRGNDIQLVELPERIGGGVETGRGYES